MQSVMAFDGTLRFDTSINTDEFENGIKKINRLTNSSMKSISEITKAAGETITDFGKQARAAGDEVTRGLSKDAKDAVDKLGDEAKETGKEFQQEMPKVAKSVESASQKIKNETGNSGKSLEALGTALKKMSKFAVDGLLAITKITAAASSSIAAFGMASIKTGMSFDTAMSQVSATLGMTTADIEKNVNGAGDRFQALRDKAQEMGENTAFTATEAADALNILAMSGYDAEESISMVNDVLDLAGAGTLDMGSAASYIAGAMKGFNEEGKTSKYYADLIAVGATKAATDVNELGAALSGSAANAALYGNSAEDTTIALLRLAEANVTGEAASTALNAAFKNLYATSGQGKDLLDKLGVSAYDELTGKAKDVNTVMNEMTAAMEGMTDAEKIAYTETIFGIQGFNAFNKMANVSIETQNEWREALENSTGAAEQMRLTMEDNLQGDIHGFESALDGLKTKVSDALVPSLRDVTKGSTEMIKSLSRAFTEGGWDGLADAAGQAIEKILTGIAQKAPRVIELGVQIIHSFCESIKNSDGLGEAGADLLATLADGILSVGADLLEVALILVTRLAEGLVEHTGPLTEKAAAVIDRLGAAFIEYAPRLGAAVLAILQQLALSIFEHLPEIIQSLITGIGALFNQFSTEYFPVLLEYAVQLFTAIVQAVPVILQQLIKALPAIVIGIKNFFVENGPEIFWAAMEMLGQLVIAAGKIAIVLLQELPKIWIVIDYVLHQAKYKILQFIADCISNVVQFLGKLIGHIFDFGKSVLSYLQENIPKWINTAIEFLKQLPGRIRNIMSSVWETVTGWVVKIINKVISVLQDLPSNILEVINFIIEKLSGFGKRLGTAGHNMAVDLANGLIEVLVNLPDTMLTIGKNIVIGVWNGIASLGSWLSNKVANFFGNAVGWVGRVLGIHSPSTVFRDKIGVFIPRGVEAGISKAMPHLLQTTRSQMEQLVDTVQADINTNVATDTSGITSALAYNRAAAERNNQVNVTGTLQSDRPIYVQTTLQVDKRKFAQEITPAVNAEMYKIDSRENNRGRG